MTALVLSQFIDFKGSHIFLTAAFVLMVGGICSGLLQAVKSAGAGYFQSSHLFQAMTDVVLPAQ